MYFDIGANKGNWAIHNVSKFSKCICVEADPETHRILCDNVKTIEKIVPLNYAVCDSNEEYVTFYKCEADTLSTLNLDWLTDEKSRFYNNHLRYSEISSKTISLDKLIQTYGIPDFIKIDVESAEYKCIKSLTTKVDHLCFEWASETNDVSINCIHYLMELGFQSFYLQNGDQYTFRPKTEEYYDSKKAIHLLQNSTPKLDWGMLWCK